MGKRLNDMVFITGIIQDKYNSSEYALGLYALERMARNPNNALIPAAAKMLLEFLQHNELDIYERLDSLVQSAESQAGHEGAEFKLMRKLVATAAVRTLYVISRKYDQRTISQDKAKELFYQFIDEQAKRLQAGSSPLGERTPPAAGSAATSSASSAMREGLRARLENELNEARQQFIKTINLLKVRSSILNNYRVSEEDADSAIPWRELVREIIKQPRAETENDYRYWIGQVLTREEFLRLVLDMSENIIRQEEFVSRLERLNAILFSRGYVSPTTESGDADSITGRTGKILDRDSS
jgi:hypothetical protein